MPRKGLSRTHWVLIGFLAITVYFLLSEHRAHFMTYLPFVLLAACPLLHLLHGHGGHGRHGAHDAHDANQPTVGGPHHYERDPR